MGRMASKVTAVQNIFRDLFPFESLGCDKLELAVAGRYAALLTLVGYSMNDTIVTFDRIRVYTLPLGFNRIFRTSPV
jgi:hypothetical protein